MKNKKKIEKGLVENKIKEDKNSKLFMSSFNLGPKLAITKEGIKSQFNNGNISQKTNKQTKT